MEMHLTLRQIEVFDAVANHLNYTRAAKALHMTQPAVSMQIRQLEDSTGAKLFEHHGRKAQLTDVGRTLLHYSKKIVSQMNDIKRAMDDHKGLKRGIVNITMASTANYFAPKLIANFHHQYPGIQIHLDVTNRHGLLKALDDNDSDLVIMGKPPEDMPLIAIDFMDNPLVVIAPPSHPLSNRKNIPTQCITDENFIVREYGSGTRAAVERFLGQKDMQRPKGMEMNSSEAIKQAVQAGLGLGVVSLHTLEMELKLKLLKTLDIKGFPIMRKWYVVHRQDKHLSPIASAFKDFIRNDAKQLLEAPACR